MMALADKVDGFVLDGRHREGCWCEHNEDGLTFIVLDKTIFRDKLGRKSAASQMWFPFRCNDPDCGARMLVRWDVLSRFVTSRGGTD